MRGQRIAVVTGASRGIGAGIARALAKEGYALALCCEKNGERLEALAKELRDGATGTERQSGAAVFVTEGQSGDAAGSEAKQYSGNAVTVGEEAGNAVRGVEVLTCVGDIADEGFVARLHDAVMARFGRIDVLVNNAGISHIGLLTDMSLTEWKRVLAVNLTSCFLTARAFAPEMVRQKSGHIIQISSMWGARGASCEVAYSASKGGVEAFTKALAKELAPSRVAVNAIACGVIDTDMNAGFSAEERAALSEDIPWDRFGTAEEVGTCVAALLRMPYTTGQVIGVDGGI